MTDHEPKLDPPWEVRSNLYVGVGQTISVWAAMEGTIIEIAADSSVFNERKNWSESFTPWMNFHVWLNIIDDLFTVKSRIISAS